VRVPNPDAQIWFDDHRTQQGGTQRTFESPPLQPGTYTYQVRAKWRQDGKDMNQTRTVTVRPGQEVRIDFARSGQGNSERLNAPNRQNQGNQNDPNQGIQNPDNRNRNNQNQNNQNRDNQSPSRPNQQNNPPD
jgi:uncharacterized protein (TIGR03000 family)